MVDNQDRRSFFGWMLKGSIIGTLGMIPGTFFNRQAVFAADVSKGLKFRRARPLMRPDSLESVYKRTSPRNYGDVLNAAKLPQEQKLAIAAVKEMDRSELRASLSRLGGGDVASGGVCGMSCGSDCGTACGISCSPAMDAMGVVDRPGNLGIDTRSIDKGRFKAAVQKLLKVR
jgi:hypothetical protein